MLHLKKKYPLKKFTTMAIGGPAKFFVTIGTEIELVEALKFAKQNRLSWYAVGNGSNLIAADKGFKGIVIQNNIQKFDLSLPSPGLGRVPKGGEVESREPNQYF